MATRIEKPKVRIKPITADGYEKFLAYAAIVLLCVVIVALARGYSQWAQVPAIVWAHLATILVALAFTPVMLLRRRGDRPHRLLGTIWVVAMMATAFISLFVRLSHPGHFSFIHLISVYVLIQVPLLWRDARRHNIASHRGSIRGVVTGALLIAGFFTFPFHRLLGTWLFG